MTAPLSMTGAVRRSEGFHPRPNQTRDCAGGLRRSPLIGAVGAVGAVEF